MKSTEEIVCATKNDSSIVTGAIHSELGGKIMNEQILRETLKDLRIRKKKGELDSEEKLRNQRVKWRDTLDYALLRRCIKHHDEEIRLEVLSLLVESKKSTRAFTEAELELIEMFLIYNLGERLEFVPLIKKALKRVKDSLAVLRRELARAEKEKEYEMTLVTSRKTSQKLERASRTACVKLLVSIEAYRTFFTTVRNICINSLYPGATYNRRRSSLQILCLLYEFLNLEFKSCRLDYKKAERLFDCLLLDTYESNKDLAYKILKFVDPFLLRLDRDDRIVDIIQVATALANGIRPIDSITAAYMLKIVRSSPIITEVLDAYGFLTESDCATSDVTLQLIILLLKKLEDPLKLAKENIVTTASRHSLYGYLFCLGSLIRECEPRVIKSEEPWRQAIGKLVAVCFELTEAVSPVVNNSSPEGHLPMDLNSQNLQNSLGECETTTVTPQMVLLCSWRTVKEVSLLFGYLSSKCPISGYDQAGGLLSEEQIIQIGEHLVTLLTETKHRGAFEQAHVGFGQLCKRLWRLENGTLRELPTIWLHQILQAIAGLAPGNSKLCATRRSAGVPFMVQALVSSEPDVQSGTDLSAFSSVMKILLGFVNLKDDSDLTDEIKRLMYEGTIFSKFKDTSNDDDIIGYKDDEKRDRVTEIKTHALNILRALFKYSQLADLVKTYIADGMIAAIRSYDGKTWAERNAATLLFSGLIVRIFGVQRTKDHVNLTVHNKMTGRIFFEKYPSLLSFTIRELKAFVNAKDTMITPSVQSILLLLSRLYPGNCINGADSSWKIDQFVELVSRCAKSRVYKTRELAARALVPLLTHETTSTIFAELFKEIASGSTNHLPLNTLHGYMLQVLEISKSSQFDKRQFPNADIHGSIASSEWILRNLESTNNAPACYPLATAYIDVLRELFRVSCEWLDDAARDGILDRLQMHLVSERILKQRPGREIYESTASKLFVPVTANSNYVRSSGESDTRITCRPLILSHPNNLVRIVGWNEAARIKHTKLDATSKKILLDRTVLTALGEILEPNQDIDLQDALYDFLYTILTDVNEKGSYRLEIDKLDHICYFVLTALCIRTRENNFKETGNFVKLMGRAYGKLSQSFKDNRVMWDRKENLYETFLNNSWMGSSDIDCRVAISEVIYDLYTGVDEEIENSHLSLSWWTALLNLLVDDSAKVRRHASLAVCKIPPESELECRASTAEMFFEKFLSTIGKVRSEIALAVLFSWSVSLTDDARHEMDETDVFNKCNNYECFEPLQISHMCVRASLKILERGRIEEELPEGVKEWLGARLNLISTEFRSFRELVVKFRERVPALDKKLESILDPTYNDKLQEALAVENFAFLVSEDQWT